MNDKLGINMKAGIPVTFREGMTHSGTDTLAQDAEYIDVQDGGSGPHFYLTKMGGPYHCSMFEEPKKSLQL